jgi:hypothetical protein
MDLVLSWSNLLNKPVSTVTQIDAAVAATHTHDNKALLDSFSVASGQLTIDGVPVRLYMEEETW